MNRKRIMKKLLKNVGVRLPVEFFSDYAILFSDDDEPIKVHVQHPDTKPNARLLSFINAQVEETKQILSKYNLKMSYHAFAMLHEIGHVLSEQRPLKEYETDLLSLETLYKNELIDEKRYIFLYNKIEEEENANKWAINWIKNNRKLAEWLDSVVN